MLDGFLGRFIVFRAVQASQPAGEMAVLTQQNQTQVKALNFGSTFDDFLLLFNVFHHFLRDF